MCGICSRRQFLTGAGAAVAAAALPGASAEAGRLPQHCSLSAGSLGVSDIMASSGDPQLDRALIAELRRILSIMPVEPGFKYAVDPAPNAFATNETVVRGTQGTVILGINLIRQEMRQHEYGGVAVAGISAHECGHIFQYFSPYSRRLGRGRTARLMELHADYLSGYYMGRRAEFSTDRIEVYARSVFSKGDYDFNHPSHHGTPDERETALMEGYRAGVGGQSFETAAARGADFVERM